MPMKSSSTADAADEEEGGARMGISRVCRSSQHCVCRKRQQNMEQPILEYGMVDRLYSQTLSHEEGVHYSTETY